jgi:hypothetical protein
MTAESVGTDLFIKNGDVCGQNTNTYAECMEASAGSNTYTPAEHQLIAYVDVIAEKVRNGQLSPAEGKYLITQYFNTAKAASNEAEARQAEAIGEAFGAAAAITEDIADRKCRAAGTC